MADPLSWPGELAPAALESSNNTGGDSAHWLQAELLGQYVIDAELGRGGMAVVFRATPVRGGPPVALKVLRQDLLGDAESRRRFEREAQLLVSLAHPNIVACQGLLTLRDGAVALVLEYAQNGTLKQRLRARAEAWTPTETRRVLDAVASGLAAAHASGVVHRDLKPDNVFFGSDERVLLGDFGIARRGTDERLTLDGDALGTPAYMAPEQLTDAEVGPAADVYAFGLLAYELLGGAAPWAGESLWTTVQKQKMEALPNVVATLARIGEPAEAIVLHQCLQKTPSERPADAGALRRALGWGGACVETEGERERVGSSSLSVSAGATVRYSRAFVSAGSEPVNDDSSMGSAKTLAELSDGPPAELSRGGESHDRSILQHVQTPARSMSSKAKAPSHLASRRDVPQLGYGAAGALTNAVLGFATLVAVILMIVVVSVRSTPESVGDGGPIVSSSALPALATPASVFESATVTVPPSTPLAAPSPGPYIGPESRAARTATPPEPTGLGDVEERLRYYRAHLGDLLDEGEYIRAAGRVQADARLTRTDKSWLLERIIAACTADGAVACPGARR